MAHNEPDWKLPVIPSEYVDASGIVRIGSSAGGPERIQLPKGIALPRSILAVTDPPTFVDQLYVYVTASELLRVILDHELGRLIDVKPFTTEDVVDAVRDLPFEPAMRFLASVQKALSFVLLDGGAQAHLMREIFGPIFLEHDASVTTGEHTSAKGEWLQMADRFLYDGGRSVWLRSERVTTRMTSSLSASSRGSGATRRVRSPRLTVGCVFRRS
jgi:hypothetical protein